MEIENSKSKLAYENYDLFDISFFLRKPKKLILPSH